MGSIKRNQAVSLLSKRAHVSEEKDMFISMKKCNTLIVSGGTALATSLNDP